MTVPLTAEVEARLALERTAWLTTLRPDGSPHMTPVWFLYERPGTWWIGSGAGSVKVRNLLADPRAALALQDGDTPVVAEGTARVHPGGSPERVVRGLADKYAGWDVTAPDQPGGARVLVEIAVARWLMAGRAR